MSGTRVAFAQGNAAFCQTPTRGKWHLIQTDPAAGRLEVATGQEVHTIQIPGMALVHGQAGNVTVRALGADSRWISFAAMAACPGVMAA